MEIHANQATENMPGDEESLTSGTAPVVPPAAYVVTLTGEATATDGASEWPLAAGDPLLHGDTLLTGDGTVVVVELADGTRKGVSSNASFKVDELAASVAGDQAKTEGELVAIENMQVSTEPYGHVVSVTGEVEALGTHGSRPLAGGEPVFGGETLLTGANGLIILEMVDGTRKGVSSDARIHLEEPATTEAAKEAKVETELVVPENIQASTEPYGHVVSVTGEVEALGADGFRSLVEGGPVFGGEVVLTGVNGLIILEMTDGTRRGISSSAELELVPVFVPVPAEVVAGELDRESLTAGVGYHPVADEPVPVAGAVAPVAAYEPEEVPAIAAAGAPQTPIAEEAEAVVEETSGGLGRPIYIERCEVGDASFIEKANGLETCALADGRLADGEGDEDLTLASLGSPVVAGALGTDPLQTIIEELSEILPENQAIELVNQGIGIVESMITELPVDIGNLPVDTGSLPVDTGNLPDTEVLSIDGLLVETDPLQVMLDQAFTGIEQEVPVTVIHEIPSAPESFEMGMIGHGVPLPEVDPDFAAFA